MRKFLAGPILIDNRGDLGLHEGPDPAQQGLIFLTQGRANVIKIAIDSWKRLLCNTRHSTLQQMFYSHLRQRHARRWPGEPVCRTTMANKISEFAEVLQK